MVASELPDPSFLVLLGFRPITAGIEAKLSSRGCLTEMKRSIDRLLSNSRGQTVVFFAGILAVLVGATALCADVAVMYMNYIQTQTAADSGAIAGASYLAGIAFSGTAATGCTTAGGYSDDAKKVACTYAANNGVAVGANLAVTEPTSSTIKVTAQRPGLPYYFGKAIGLSTYDVAATATAQANQPVSQVNSGMFPVGLQCTSPCNLSTMDPGQSVTFGSKFVGGLAPGNWQWLSVQGTGSSNLATRIDNGATATFKIGDSIDSEPGNKGNAGPVTSGFSDRMSRCATITDPCANSGNPKNIPAGDPCLVILPAVDYHGCAGRCTMTIEGFALIYLEKATSTSTSIQGCFVQAIADGTVTSSTAPQLGAEMPPTMIQ
jgi:hypothetical protein